MTDIQHFGQLIKDIKFAMLTTVDSGDGSLHSRPMTLQEVEFDGSLWFFGGRSTAWVQHIQVVPKVNLAFANPKDMSFVSATGHAEVVIDHEKAKELWNPMYKAWFPEGLEDPDLCLIRVDIESADYWESPNSKLVTMVGFAKAAITGQPLKNNELGKHGHLQM